MLTRLYKSQKYHTALFDSCLSYLCTLKTIHILRYLQINNNYLQKITESLDSFGWISQLALADVLHRVPLAEGDDLIVLLEPGTAEHLLDLQQTRAAGVGDEEVREGHGECVCEREGPDPEVDAEHRLDRVVDLDRQEGTGEADAVH